MIMGTQITNLTKLGQEYSPGLTAPGARTMMKRMIADTVGLDEALRLAGFNGKTVTPKIRQIFYEYLGEP